MDKFDFKLHPRIYCFPDDDKVVFSATKVMGGYKIRWDKKFFPVEGDKFPTFAEDLVLRNIADGDWIVQQEDTLN